jgi:hypothetical protein
VEEPLPAERQALVPDIPGLANPPDPPPEVLYPPKPNRSPWQIEIGRAAISDAREIWIDAIQLTGAGAGSGRALTMETKGGPVSAGELHIDFGSGSIRIGETELGTELAVKATVQAEPFKPKGIQLDALLPLIGGSVAIDGVLSDLSVLDDLVSVPSVSLGGYGETHLRVELDRGRLMPGTSIEVVGDGLAGSYLDYQVRGEGAIRGKVAEADGGTMGELSLRLDDFALAWQDDPPYVAGSGFTLSSTLPDPDLLRGGKGAHVVVDLPPSTITDFAQFNRYLPPGLGVAFTGGSARLSSHFEMAQAEQAVSGRMGFDATGVSARWEGASLAGNIALESVLAEGSIADRSFSGAETTLELSELDVTDEAGEPLIDDWWAHLRLEDGRLTLGEVPELQARLGVEMRDSSPLSAAVGQRRPNLEWLAEAFEVRDVVAVAQVAGRGDALAVKELELTGDRLTALADVILVEGQPQGIVFTKFGALRVGAELQDEETDWKILGPRAWYDEKLEVRRSERTGGG